MARYTGRLAGYDRNSGDPITDTEVLSADELAEDYGWISRQPTRPVTHDPALVAQVVALQRAAS